MTDFMKQEEMIEKLWHAAETGDAGLIRLLVSRGVDVTTRNKDGWTPLHVATQYGHAEAMRVLISARAMQRMSQNDFSTSKCLTWNEKLKQSSSSHSSDAA